MLGHAHGREIFSFLAAIMVKTVKIVGKLFEESKQRGISSSQRELLRNLKRTENMVRTDLVYVCE